MSYERKPFKAPYDLDLTSALVATFRPRNRFLTLSEIMALPPAEWLVKGLVPANGFQVVYGKPGAGKTFFVLAMALSIAHGMQCFGRRTAQGNVALVAGEGAVGLQNRLKAWHQLHGLDLDGCDGVAVLPQPSNLLDADNVEQLILDIHHRFGGQPVRLVVFDTLARCFGDGDENRQADMARLIEAGELVRQTLGCAVLFVHHTPKEADELRGSSVLEGASDAVLRISKGDTVMEVFVRKMKDGKDNVALGFRMEAEEVGIDADGDPILTPVAVLEGDVRDGGTEHTEVAPSGKNQQAVLAVLAAHESGLTDEEWREQAKVTGAVSGANPNRAFREARAALVKAGLVLQEGNRFLAA